MKATGSSVTEGISQDELVCAVGMSQLPSLKSNMAPQHLPVGAPRGTLDDHLVTPHLNRRLQALLWQERRGRGESRFFMLPRGSEPFTGHVAHAVTPTVRGWECRLPTYLEGKGLRTPADLRDDTARRLMGLRSESSSGRAPRNSTGRAPGCGKNVVEPPALFMLYLLCKFLFLECVYSIYYNEYVYL